jgi:uncharacterized membrane protein
MTMKCGSKEWLVFIISILLLTDLTILLNIPFLRQILGFLFLIILPGLLILQILKLDKIGSTEKIILTVGLSTSFLMFFGLMINNLSLSLGYKTPLSTISLLISFNIAFIALAVLGYKINKNLDFSFLIFDLSTSEKAFLTVPILFPALSIFGMHVMNTTGNNIILLFLLLLIPAYVVFVCFFNQKFTKRLYPVAIFLISLSLLLLLSLRSNHIIGTDAHVEYYFFQTTMNNLHWSIAGHSSLDACLTILLLPAIYQSILNVSSEFLFKILYSLIYSISPLVIYVISKKYVDEVYGFLAACFFMFQSNFLFTEWNARTNTAILFFALAMMILFSDKIDPLKKRILFIVFMASCIVSHYSTTYIFFFIMLGTFIGIEMLPKKYTFKKVVSLTIVILFFSLIFLWYSLVTETAFNAGVGFIENTLSNLNKFFIEELRTESVPAMFGEGIVQKGIPHKIEFVFTWLTFALIGIGIVTLLVKRKEMLSAELGFKKPKFLKDKFEVTYFMIALACAGLLVTMVALPFVSVGYSMGRLYAVAITILSVFFVIGGIILSKNLSLNLLRKVLSKTLRGKKGLSKKQKEKRNTSQVRAYLIILLVLIPYFFCVTGVMYNIFGVPRAITLNSEGEQYDMMYVHDQESYGAKWLEGHTEEGKIRVYGDRLGRLIMVSQATIRFGTNAIPIDKPRMVEGYVFLRYDNVINDRLYIRGYHNITEFKIMFVGKSMIYNNGGSEVWS